VFSTADTIVAVATPAGRGGLGVIRLSGPDAPAIACRLMRRPSLEPRHATFGHISDAPDPRAPHIDQVVATWFAAPHSYTSEEVVEISAHGSPPLLLRIVELAMDAGARLAEPGEFTLRAYLNGRIDLVQAEAVRDLIDAVTPLQARVAMDQLEGTLTTAIARIDRMLFDLAARLEASLDFPDEGFHFITRDETVAELDRAAGAVSVLVREGRAGRVLREGTLVAIVGPTNAGKSSLFNTLVGSARAIVTDVPGTTRDLLSETVDLEGLAVTLVDTAGVRDTVDPIEAEGVRRAEQTSAVAALTLLVLDGSQEWTAAALSRSRLPRSPDPVDGGPARRRLVVANKCDLPRAWDAAALAAFGVQPAEVVEVSATRGDGLAVLRQRIARAVTDRDHWRDPPAVSNVRHLQLLDRAGGALDRAREALSAGATEELVLVELSDARHALEAITGRRTPDDVLHHIFGRFCVGK
jgi:tRNA modification GTPase